MAELVQDQVAALIAAGLEAAQASGALPDFEMPAVVVEHPRQSEHEQGREIGGEVVRVEETAGPP